MCDACGIADLLALVRRARRTADAVLDGYLRLPVRKAVDLASTRGFDRAVAGLAAELRASTAASDLAAVRDAVAVLDVDWRATTAAQRRSLVAQALAAAVRRTAAVPKAIEAGLGDAATEVVQATRDSARRRGLLSIAADFNALDRRIVRHLRTSQANFVRDEYGRRHEVFGAQARRIVSEGLETGLGRQDIAHELERAAKNVITGKSSIYWEVVASSFVSRGRSFAQLSSFAEAGIERYVWESVEDERTTEICRFMHGKVFTVSAGIRTFERVDQEPDRIKELTPWVRKAIDPDTGRNVLFVERGGERVRIAEVSRSAVGTRDDRGEFAGGRSERELMDLGVSMPPAHALCRATATALAT